MALRNQPFIPLFVQDFLTDEKLNECSASAHGVYIKLMCLLHKSETYGKILLEQKYKQHDKPLVNFAYKFARHLPFDFEEIISGLNELSFNGVIQYNESELWQKRMVRDNEISELRALAGYKGGKNTQIAKANIKANTKANIKANIKANTEYENEYENEYEYEYEIKDINKKEKNKSKKKKFVPPSLEEVKIYFKENGYSEETAENAYKYYNEGNWYDSRDKPVLNWKQKMRAVWFRDENKSKESYAEKLKSW